MADSNAYMTGVIEGYYGRSWSHQTRLDYASYLSALKFNTCIYSPKEDPYLRRNWQSHWPQKRWRQLLELASAYRDKGINWGVGLSPFALYQNYGAPERRQLRIKLEQLAELEAPLLAILFDDMPGDLDALASRQADIVADVVQWQPAVKVLVCPTYYSFDTVLETHFGTMPEGYWRQLGGELPSQVDIFWTGNRVCSETISKQDILKINREFGRKVVLWDNYPVNDGAQRSQFLYCHPLSGRSPQLSEVSRGHLCNPMNQALLSLPALVGLADLYEPGLRTDMQLTAALGARTWELLQQYRDEFQLNGLQSMSEERKNALASKFAALPGAAASEVAGWLRGAYRFDPACLTD